MKLFDGGRAPNPRRVRIFLAEKNIIVPLEAVDLGKLEHKTPAFSAINPLQRVPALQLDDGTIITESMAICRYFEALRPEPALFGHGAAEIALVEMWNRRVELNLYGAVSAVFRHLHPAMKDMEQQVPEWGEANKSRAYEFLNFMDRELKERLFLAGDHFSVADITALVSVDFMKVAKLTLAEDLIHIKRWHNQVSARPSAKA